MIADVVQLVRVEGEFDTDPDFLVQQEQVDIVQQWGHILLAKGIVTAASNHNCAVDRQVRHGVAKAGARSLTIRFNWHELALNHFSVDSDWLEVAKFIHEFAITLLSTEVVDTILNRVTLSLLKLVFSIQISRRNDSTGPALNNGQHGLSTALQLQLDPLTCVHMEDNHILANHAILSLTSVNHHTSLVSDSGVIFSRSDGNTFSLDHVNGGGLQIVLKHLISALSHLPLAVEMETTTENEQFLLVMDGGVALTTLNLLLRGEINFFPVDAVAHHSRANDFFDRLAVHATDHVAGVAASGEGCGFTRRRHPGFTLRLNTNFSSKAFSFLHSLHKGLDTSSELLSQLIPGNVVCRIGSESSTSIVFTLLRLNKQNFLLNSISLLHKSLLPLMGKRVFKRLVKKAGV